MVRLNKAERKAPVFTHGGAKAVRGLRPEQELERAVLSCFLWEDQFYEDGASIADRITSAADRCDPEFVADLAVKARTDFNLRHAPLLLLESLSRNGKGRLVGDAIFNTILRADEPGEFLAICNKRGMSTLSKQMKVGLARALKRFDEYQLAKYNRSSAMYSLKDVLFLSHARPDDEVQAGLFKRLVDNQLATPDTWETNLSGGADKKETFERLLREKKLGYLALLRNLRNMDQAGVDENLVRDAILARRGAHNVFPFRFITAAKHAPKFEPELDQAMIENMAQAPKLKGKTIALIDISGSMGYGRMSSNSEMDRLMTACSLGAVLREVCEVPRIYATAGSDGRREHATGIVPARRGMALVSAISDMRSKLGGGGIFTQQAVDYVLKEEGNADRIICITDEQDCSGYSNSPSKVKPFGTKGNYLINVASYDRSINYGQWTQINGFSEGVIRYILETEASQA